MSKVSKHPAAALPEPERAEYWNVVASLAVVDGSVAEDERKKIGRLGEVLELSEDVRKTQLAALSKGRTSGAVTREAMDRIRDQPMLRTSLMMDAIVIAFSDGKLMPSESKQLGLLARGLGISHEEVLKTARLVERILFSREGESDQALTAEFGESLAGAPSWLRRVSGIQEAITP